MKHRTSFRRRLRLVSLLGILLMLVATPLAIFSASPASDRPLLRLHRGTIDAGQPETNGITADPSRSIIQFEGPITPADRNALQQTGVTIIEYLPDYAYLVRGQPDQLAAAAALPRVYSQTPFTTADKLAPVLLSVITQGLLQEALPLTIRGWEGGSAPDEAIISLGLDPDQAFDIDQIQTIIAHPAIRWVEPVMEYRLQNNEARTIMSVPAAWEHHGLFGAGQVVGIADSGLDTGDLETMSPDFAGRIVATHVLANGGDLGDEFGHGTHVAGSLAGAGVQSGADPATQQYEGSFAGVAPEASLVIQAFEVDNDGIVTGLELGPEAIFAQAYASGARIHSNSWGGITGIPFLDPAAVFGGYPETSRDTDAFIWQHPDTAIFFAAGNSGNDGWYIFNGCLPIEQDGVVDLDSLNAPGTAKNVITVGATENIRTDAPRSDAIWSNVDPTCFGLEPLASDLISDNPNGIAAFSSRGPTDDGRLKPDLVAPGTNVLSNRSHDPDATGTLWGLYDANPHYQFSGGTSMATPLAAGAGVLVREWLGRQGLTNPSAAAIKAVLLNTTVDIAPGQYGTGTTQEIPFSRPNPVSGWGRVDLGFLAEPEPYRLWLDDQPNGLATGQVQTYQDRAEKPLFVVDDSQPLRITLAWTDPPASLSAARQLVNDLDLVVIDPDGRQYWGNQATGGDRINNVEGVIITKPEPGAYQVEVRAHNVPIESQPYALAVAGPIAPPTLVLEANTGITITTGGQAPITADTLRAAGAAPEQIRYALTSVPAHGDLTLDGLRLDIGQLFSQADVDAGRLRYNHDGSATTSDSFGFVARVSSNATLAPDTFMIMIEPTDEAARPPEAPSPFRISLPLLEHR
jgi:serine protease AprX